MLGVALDASFVYWLVLLGFSFSRWEGHILFPAASVFIHFERNACGTGERGRSTMIDSRYVERMETESCVLCATSLRQVDNFSRPGATFSSGHLFPAVVVAVICRQSLEWLRCWQSQPSSTLLSSGRSQIGLLSLRSFETGVLGTTSD